MSDESSSDRPDRARQLRLPPQPVPVERSVSRAAARGNGIGPAFSDPCEEAGSYDEWLSCRDALDPLVLY
jgi:hypothetical protein